MSTIAVLMFDGVPMFETSVPISVFGMDRTNSGAPKFRLLPVAAECNPVITTGGVRIHAPYGLEDLEQAGIVMIPSWRGADEDVPKRSLRAIRAAHADGAIVVGLSTGAFVLAATGLLDGRRAATHWLFAAALAARYPKIQVDPAVLYVDDGDVITSAGTAAGLDACLHIVARFWGVKAASAISRRMAIPPRRSGAQAQVISDAIQSGSDSNNLSEIMEFLVRNLDQHIDIDRIAEQFNISRRTFDRQFRAATGLSPIQWILRQRVLRAQHLLETTDLTVEAIAHQVGLSKAVSLRPLFHRIVGVSPQHYRASFRGHSRQSQGR
ncbi:GlxA family transcriptional regulator [Mycobacterium paraffinicum]|nr:helix-turn-helix domain-containing protein [Mycobacterium paraffinicum]